MNEKLYHLGKGFWASGLCLQRSIKVVTGHCWPICNRAQVRILYDSLVVGFCKPCISKAMSLLNEYYAILHEERLINFPSLPHLQALHEND